MNEIRVNTDKQGLATLLVKLLGQRRTLAQDIQCDSDYVISLENIFNIYNCVDQRVRQNDGALIEANFKFYYQNGKIVTLADPISFLSYRDTESTVCEGVSLTLKYLIAFPPELSPEAQEIQIDIMRSVMIKNHLKVEKRKRFARLSFRIDATNVTWAQDVHSLLLKELELHFGKNSFIKFLQKTLSTLSLTQVFALSQLISLSAFSVILWLHINSMKTNNLGLNARLKSINGTNIQTINDKLDIILQHLLQLDKVDSLSLFPKALLISMAFPAVYFLASKFLSPIFVLKTNKASEDEVLKVEKDRNILMSVVIIGFIVSVCASLFYDKFFT